MFSNTKYRPALPEVKCMHHHAQPCFIPWIYIHNGLVVAFSVVLFFKADQHFQEREREIRAFKIDFASQILFYRFKILTDWLTP